MSRSGVFWYCRMALWNLSVSSEPSEAELSVRRRLTVLTPISALQLLCGNAVEDSLWWIPQSKRNFLVSFDVNSGPPSEASSPGIPNVVNLRLRHFISPFDPCSALSTMGQFEYLSTTTR